MSATGPAVAAAMLATAAVLPAGPARSRWRAFVSARAPAPAAPAPARPAWIVIGCCAAAAMGWVIGGAAAAVACGLAVGVVAACGRSRAGGTVDAAELAGCWEMLAACLEAGLPVSAAVLATAGPSTDPAGGAGRASGTDEALRRVAGLLELGADPVDAWRTVERRPELAAFARAAARSAGTGSALAKVARTECARLRATLTDTAQARAQRAAVLITGPLGICFLPAFLALGVAPVVIGLASEALARW